MILFYLTATRRFNKLLDVYRQLQGTTAVLPRQFLTADLVPPQAFGLEYTPHTTLTHGVQTVLQLPSEL